MRVFLKPPLLVPSEIHSSGRDEAVVSEMITEIAMMVSLFRHGALRGTCPRRRAAIVRTPRFESLEERRVPAVLVLPVTSLPTFTASVEIAGSAGFNTFNNVPVAGGNFLGTFNTTPLSQTYGLNPVFSTTVGITYYSATSTNNGTIYGTGVQNAGAIAWLVVNLGPAATTTTQQNALQAAIWKTEFGVNFVLDSNNDPALISQYNADLVALDDHSLPVGSVMWISPSSGGNLSLAQSEGLVALPPGTSTETAISTSASSAAFGQPVALGALVVNSNSIGPTPTGSVQFQVDGVNIGNPVPFSTSGTASFIATTISAGSHVVGAVYEPTGSFGLSASIGQTLTITPDVTSISFRSLARQIEKGKAINLVATVQSESGSTAVPVGTAVFVIDGQIRPAVNLSNGSAVRKRLKLGPGTHTITVYYTPANGNFTASQGQHLVTVIGDPSPHSGSHNTKSHKR
jgi:hypothetical protein